LDYGNDGAVICCIEGLFLLKEGEVKTKVQAGDVTYVPKKKGLKVEWPSRKKAEASTSPTRTGASPSTRQIPLRQEIQS
jgi:hypothetical protein